MADDVTLPGTGEIIAADEVGGAKIQRIKVGIGADGSSTDLAFGQATKANSLPVTFPSDVDPLAVLGNVAHDAADSGAPVKVGGRARSALPAAVASDDRADFMTDLMGRLLIAHIPPSAQVFKLANYTTMQTGATIWDPTSGKKIAITHMTIASKGSTSGHLILWFGANGDTTYSAGTDQLVFEASFAPSVTAFPGAVIPLPHPIYCQTADHELHATTDANLSVDIVVYGYEWA